MVMSEKRKRGRPPGTGKDDGPFLAQVANILLQGKPGTKPTTAMRQVIRTRKWEETDATLLRRWQVKWKESGEHYLSEARQALAAREIAQALPVRVRARDVLHHGVTLTPELRRTLRNMGHVRGVGEVRLAMETARILGNTPLAKVGVSARDLQAAIDTGLSNPVAKALAQHQAIAKQIKAVADAIRPIQEHERVMKVIKAYEDAISPIRQHEELMKTIKGYGGM